MDFNNPQYYEEPIIYTKNKHKDMNSAIAFLEADSWFDEDNVEVVSITAAHRAVYMGMMEALEEVKKLQATEYSTAIIDQLINKYKKKI